MGKKRSGGGAKSFMKSVMSRSDAKEEEANQLAAANGPAQPDSASTQQQAPAADGAAAAAQPATVPAAQHAAPAATAAPAPAPAAPKEETRGQMLQRHKRELKAVKDAVKQLGKKRKDEGEKLEADTAARHAAEVAAQDAGAPAHPGGDGSDAGAEALVANSLYGLPVAADGKPDKKESTRAQKRREKSERQQVEREERIAAEQAEMGDSDRQVEEAALARLLAPQGLALRDIPPDGNCLYRAVEDQLSLQQHGDGGAPPPGHQHQQLRLAAVDYMRSHEKEFAPFVLPEVEENGGDDAHERFQQYCDAMAGAAVWGGQAELGALAHALQRRIDVFSVSMPTVAMGEEYADNGPPVRVSYQRHAYEMGEHYNSVVAAAGLDEEAADDAA